MKTGFKNAIKKKLIVSKVMHEENVNGVTYKVIESKCMLPGYKERRALAFFSEKDKRVYIQSMIYLNKKYNMQPCMISAQKVIGIWGRNVAVDDMLLLGCAGSAVARYTALQFPGSKIKGVEHSPRLIEIAKKYFLLDEIKDEFEIIKADAFEFVKSEKTLYDVIFVDLFDTERLSQEVYSQSFVANLCRLGKENSVIIFNMLNEDKEKIIKFAKETDRDDIYKKILLSSEGRNNLVLIKKGKGRNLDKVIKEINENWEAGEI